MNIWAGLLPALASLVIINGRIIFERGVGTGSDPETRHDTRERAEKKPQHTGHDQVINLDSRRCIIYDLWGAIVYSPILYRSGQCG